MTKKERITAFAELGNHISLFLSGKNICQPEFEQLIQQVYFSNKWFVEENTRSALFAISQMLNAENLRNWVESYEIRDEKLPKRVAVIMAGNIPLVGFHDLLCVLISGNILVAKPSSQDELLLRFVLNKLVEINPEFEQFIEFSESLIKNFDAVIATGSNNSSRYFQRYFSNSPHIIRQHRNSVAILNGKESAEDITNLGKDIFMYFGLGCRNVSKIFVPKNFRIENILKHFEAYQSLNQHSKYFNNYEFNKSVFLINKVQHLDTGFLLLTQNESLYSSVAVLHYEFYENEEDLKIKIESISNELQCIVGSIDTKFCDVSFGNSQFPELNDYADKVDTMAFLCNL